MHQSWEPIINEFLKDPKLIALQNIIDKNPSIYFPSRENIFNVFNTPLASIKIVILGQDPYPKRGHACGYAFMINENITKPFSLRIMEKELGRNIDFKEWINKGVFLLNTALTVEEGKPGSHLEYWKDFTIKVINYISKNHQCEWLLMGKHAQSFAKNINEDNKIFEIPHPASEVYRRGFVGSGIFNKTIIGTL